MEGLREYLLRLLWAALVCGIVNRTAKGSVCAPVIRLLCGVFLTVVLVQPLCGLSFEEPLRWTEDLNALGAEIVAQGSQEAQAQKEAIIKTRLEAYIVEKAAQAGASVTADITLGGDGLPRAVTVTGALSPAAKGRLKRMLTQELGIPLIIALAPKTYADQPGILYEGHNYRALGEQADAVLLMTYEWGYAYGPPMAVAPLGQVRAVLDYALTAVAPEKIFMGIPLYGYDWPLPFVSGETRAESLSPVQAVERALRHDIAIQYDAAAQAPYYHYTDRGGREHAVWFEDARSIEAKLRLADEYHLQGVGYWNLTRPFPQNWAVLASLFDIETLL